RPNVEECVGARAGSPEQHQPQRRSRFGHYLPQMPAEGALPPLFLGRGAGSRLGTVSGRRAGLGPADQLVGKILALVSAESRGGGTGGTLDDSSCGRRIDLELGL